MDWVDLPKASRQLLPQCDALAAWARSNGINEFILCGMGGSSLAAEVISKKFNSSLQIIDSTQPQQILDLMPKELAQTLIIFSSKSGTTIETLSHYKYFTKVFIDNGLDPKKHIVIITDENSPLDTAGRSEGFKVLYADPNIGGRFSAITTFGLLPATLVGADVSVILDDAEKANIQLALPNSAAVVIAAALYSLSDQIVEFNDDNSQTPGLSDWIEQLISESTGKDGKGRLPVVSNSQDTISKLLRVGFKDGEYDLVVEATLGEHFILWQWVTVLLCLLLKVNPFDQPNVLESKEKTKQILNQYEFGVFKNQIPKFESDEFLVYSNLDINRLDDFFDMHFGYIAVMAYLPSRRIADPLVIQRIISSRAKTPTTFGWGPRFLHSTGQIHKGGKANGGFIQITQEVQTDLDIPSEKFTFGQLISAQAIGDAVSLAERELPFIRIHLKNQTTELSEILN
jgi:glucose-6-phosphate isomerase